MKAELEKITTENLNAYKAFEETYDEHLKVYMSRLYPDRHEKFESLNKDDLLRWYYIVADGRRVGSIWLEKEKSEDDSAVLGLFIDDDEMRGKGIGKIVIDEIIKKDAKSLNITTICLNVRANNPRAIRCYEQCGFNEYSNRMGSKGIVVINMKKELLDSWIELEQITAGNIEAYKIFENTYEDHLKIFMSRLHPNNHEDFEKLNIDGLLRWYYIVTDGRRIGSIWLEKEKDEDDSAVLALFIDDNAFRGQDIGEYIINYIIKKDASDLNLSNVILRVRSNNPRAIRCYEKCGFYEVARGIGSTGIVGLEMVRDLHQIP